MTTPDALTNYSPFHTSILTRNMLNERNIIKAFLLSHLHHLFCNLFHKKIQFEQNNSLMESYTVDNKIIQLLIQGIIETGEYTLEGIALYTKIPFDVIFDAACGNNTQLSITPWARVVNLYMQVKPEVTQLLFNRLLERKDKKDLNLSSLLNE